MALLHKIRILENERIDKPDHDQIQEFVADDFKAYNRHFFTNEDKWIGKGFSVSVTSGLNIAVVVEDSTLFNTEVAGGNEFYLGESGHADLTATLTNGATNYIHLQVVSGNTGTAATRVFWDPTLNSGDGGEFLQTIDTEEYLDVQLYVNTTGFSTDDDLIPLATMVTSGGAVVSTIDNRNLFFRLGKGHTLNAEFDFELSSPTEPASSSFTGGDKDIASLKDWMDLVMTRIKKVSGETYWFEDTGGFNVTDLYTDFGNTIMTGGGTISYSAANVFSFSSDLVLTVISLGVTYTIPQASESGQTLADGQVAYINIDAALGGASSGERGTSGNRDLVIANASAVPFDQNIYWVAYRTGTKLFVRGMRQELEQGEESQLGDGISSDLLAFIGSTGETDSSPNYTSNHYVTDGTSLLTAISALDAAMFSLDHGGLSGLGDDDHPQYPLAGSTETISGAWTFSTIPSCAVAPTTGSHLTNKTYVDGLVSSSIISDHGALSGLSDDDHPQYPLAASAENITGAWYFTADIGFAGQSSPEADIHIGSGGGSYATSASTQLLLDSALNNLIQFSTGSSATSGLVFSSNVQGGEYLYSHASTNHTWKTAGLVIMTLNSSGELQLANVDPPTANYGNRNGFVKGWLSYTDGSGSVADSYNVAGLTDDDGDGQYDITWDTDFGGTKNVNVACVNRGPATDYTISITGGTTGASIFVYDVSAAAGQDASFEIISCGEQ